MTSVAEVRLWSRTIGAVSIEEEEVNAAFQYDPDFATSKIELSPVAMPLSSRIYTFPSLPVDTFHGLPGLLADSLQDRFGNTLIDAWRNPRQTAEEPQRCRATLLHRLPRNGRPGVCSCHGSTAQDERHAPGRRTRRACFQDSQRECGQLQDVLSKDDTEDTLADILRVGTSAGGARAKAVVTWNQTTQEVRSGQIDADSGFEYWLIKFDGVSGNKDDHVKNIAFLMEKSGDWHLSPAFDVTYSDNPSGKWTAEHQMSINGKRDGFEREDYRASAKVAQLKRGRSESILDQIVSAVSRWEEFAAEAGVAQDQTDKIRNALRLEFD